MIAHDIPLSGPELLTHPNGVWLRFADAYPGNRRNVAANTARVIVFVVALAAVVIVMLVTGWADDRAPAGSKGRVPVTYTPADDSR